MGQLLHEYVATTVSLADTHAPAPRLGGRGAGVEGCSRIFPEEYYPVKPGKGIAIEAGKIQPPRSTTDQDQGRRVAWWRAGGGAVAHF